MTVTEEIFTKLKIDLKLFVKNSYTPLHTLHLYSPSVPAKQVTGRTSSLPSLLQPPLHENPTSDLVADTKSQTDS